MGRNLQNFSDHHAMERSRDRLDAIDFQAGHSQLRDESIRRDGRIDVFSQPVLAKAHGATFSL
jgi:hypothetical protein